MTLPLTVLILGHAYVYIYIPYGGNIISYVKAMVNKFLSFTSTLNVPDIKLYNGHI